MSCSPTPISTPPSKAPSSASSSTRASVAAPAAGAATLALVEEEAEEGAFDGGVEIGVGEHDIRALAAQFEADPLEVALGRRLHDDLPGQVFAGECDLIDVHVLAETGAGRRAETGNDVDDPVGEAGFLGQGGDAQGGQRRLLGRLEHDRDR